MHRILAAAALCVVTLAASAQSADAARVSTFKGALAQAYQTCAGAYRLAQLDQKLGRMADAQARRNYGATPDYTMRSDAAGNAAKQFVACKTEAQGKGVEAFKAFADGLPDGQLKADGRALLTAWIAFLGNASGSVADFQSPQGGEYSKASAALDVDAAGI